MLKYILAYIFFRSAFKASGVSDLIQVAPGTGIEKTWALKDPGKNVLQVWDRLETTESVSGLEFLYLVYK